MPTGAMLKATILVQTTLQPDMADDLCRVCLMLGLSKREFVRRAIDKLIKESLKPDGLEVDLRDILGKPPWED